MGARDDLKEAMRLAGAGRLDDALAALARGRHAAPADPVARAMLAKAAGTLCAHAGRLQDAIDHYLEATALDPADVYLMWALGDAYDRLGNTAEAKARWSTFVTSAQGSADPAIGELLAHHLERMARRGW